MCCNIPYSLASKFLLKGMLSLHQADWIFESPDKIDGKRKKIAKSMGAKFLHDTNFVSSIWLIGKLTGFKVLPSKLDQFPTSIEAIKSL